MMTRLYGVEQRKLLVIYNPFLYHILYKKIESEPTKPKCKISTDEAQRIS